MLRSLCYFMYEGMFKGRGVDLNGILRVSNCSDPFPNQNLFPKKRGGCPTTLTPLSHNLSVQ